MDELWRTAPTPAARLVLGAGGDRFALNPAAEAWGRQAGLGEADWGVLADELDARAASHGHAELDAGAALASTDLELPLGVAQRPVAIRCVRLPDGWLLWITPPADAPRTRGELEEQDGSELLGLALTLAGISVWQLDPAEQTIRFSAHGARILGRDYGARPMPLADVRATIHPEDLAEVGRTTAEALAHDRVVDVMTRYQHIDGSWKHLLTRRVAQRDAQGRVTALLGVALDLSELVTERELSITLLSRMELAAETLGVGFWSRDLHTDTVQWDARMYLLYGRRPDEGPPPLEEWLRRHVHPDDAARMARRAGARWDHRSPAVQECFRILLPDGSERWVQNWTRRLLRDGRTIDFGLQMDVTERRHAELRTERERERDRFAIESAGIGVWERAFSDRASYWSPAMYRLRGLLPGDSRPLKELVALTVHADDVAEADRRMVRCIELGETYRHEFAVHWPDGTERWLASTGRAVRDASGQVVALAGVNVDITERHLASALARERDRAEQASAAKSGLMARVSHELRTPMNAVLGFAELMAQDFHAPLATRQVERLDQIRSAGGHLLGLIDDLLELSRAEAGGRPIQLEPVSLAELLRECLQWVAALAQQHGVRVEAQLPLPPGMVLADRRRLGQVLVNLLTNGIKYNRAGGHVQIGIRAADLAAAPAWELCVQDDGRGLSKEQIARLFEPFNRLGAEREGIPGTGIGLSIVQQLVHDMGGQLTVESEHGRGSTFRVCLPAAAEQPSALLAEELAVEPPGVLMEVAPGAGSASGAVAPAVATAGARLSATSPAGAPPMLAPLRVIYVEDNPVNEMLVREMLSLRPAVQLETAPDGGSGIAQAIESRPDVILLDLQLPDVSGIEVLHRLRTEPGLAHSSFVALSANAMPDDVRHALAEGFDDYWTKPLDLMRFLAAIDALAAQHGRASGPGGGPTAAAIGAPFDTPLGAQRDVGDQGASRSRSQVPSSRR